MRLIVISDTHNILEGPLPEGDVLIHCGDATMGGTEKEVLQFAKWWNPLPFTKKLFVPGNHDFLFQKQPEKATSMLEDTDVLIDKGVTIEGRIFYGSPWVPNLPMWAFYGSHTTLKEKFEKIDGQTDVLITHGPPYGILDKMYNGEHVGSKELLGAVQTAAPCFHLFGHIHEEGGRLSMKLPSFCLSINAAMCDEHYNLAHFPTVIDI